MVSNKNSTLNSTDAKKAVFNALTEFFCAKIIYQSKINIPKRKILGEREKTNKTNMTYTNKVTTLGITSNYGNSDRQHALRSTHKN